MGWQSKTDSRCQLDTCRITEDQGKEHAAYSQVLIERQKFVDVGQIMAGVQGGAGKKGAEKVGKENEKGQVVVGPPELIGPEKLEGKAV